MTFVRTFLPRVLILTLTTVLLGVLLTQGTTAPYAHADASTDAIQAQINAHNQQIQALDGEIAQYQKQLAALNSQHATLSTTIQSLTAQRNKITAEIKTTQNKIATENLIIQQLTVEISSKQRNIDSDRRAMSESLRDIQAAEGQSLVEQLLSSDTLADAWSTIDTTAAFNVALRHHASDLATVKSALQNQQAQVASTTKQLTMLTDSLQTQQGSLDATAKTKSDLLSQTKAQESQYQQLIKQKRAEQASFQAALYALASQLKAADTSGIPAMGSGVLRWPLDKIVITQMFGKTSDSGRLYASGTHDGVDFAANTGTPIRAALTGTVYATNEGNVQNCQYGKWVLIKHANGLATLYAHLSQISVSNGQSVATGEVIGYSGMTGYATGPHLHLTVYVASSVTLKQYTCKSGPTVTIPIAPPNGYLNPTAYL